MSRMDVPGADSDVWRAVEILARRKCREPVRGASCMHCHQASYRELTDRRHLVACQCCDCVPQLSLSSMASDIRMLPRGTYTIEPPFLANGQHNIKSNLAECQLACAENEQCRTGTFILSGVDRGECWLAKRHGARQLCTQPCQSFEKP